MDNPADDEEPAVGLLDLPLTFLTQLVQHPYCEGLRSVCQRLFALGLAASSQACFMLDDGQTIESAATAVALAERSENVPHLECRRLNGTLADILVAAAAQLGVQSLPSFTELTLIDMRLDGDLPANELAPLLPNVHTIDLRYCTLVQQNPPATPLPAPTWPSVRSLELSDLQVQAFLDRAPGPSGTPTGESAQLPPALLSCLAGLTSLTYHESGLAMYDAIVDNPGSVDEGLWVRDALLRAVCAVVGAASEGLRELDLLLSAQLGDQVSEVLSMALGRFTQLETLSIDTRLDDKDISLILSHPTIRDLSLLPDEQCDLSQDLSHHPCRLRRITLRNPTLSLLTHLPLQAVTESVTLASRFSYVTFNVPHDTTTQLARAVVSNCVSDHRPVRWDATWVAVVCGGVDTHTGTYTETESDTDLDGGSDAGTHRPVVQPHSAELLVILAPLWHGFQGPGQVQNAYVTVSVIEALSHCPVCEITWEECEFAPDAWAALLPRAPAAAARVTLRWRREWYETRDLARLFASSKAESHRSLCVRLECTSEKRWEEDAWDETVQEMIDKAHSESGGRVTFVLGEGDFNVM